MVTPIMIISKISHTHVNNIYICCLHCLQKNGQIVYNCLQKNGQVNKCADTEFRN